MKTSTTEILITFSDLKRLLRKLYPRLKQIFILCAALSFSYFLIKEPKYLAQASFKHRPQQNSSSNSLRELFESYVSSSSTDTPIYAIMYSDEVLRDVVEELGLQVRVNPGIALVSRLQNIWENIAVQMRRELPDVDAFAFRHVHYHAEKGMSFYVRPLNAGEFEVLDRSKQVIAHGQLGVSVELDAAHFTLAAYPKNVVFQKLYACGMRPWRAAVDGVKRCFELKSHRVDKNILLLYFADRDRHLASAFLNQVMASYQKYLMRENEEICEAQIHYLEKRQNELAQHYDQALKEHVTYLQSNLSENGMMGFMQELEVLSEPQQDLTNQLFAADLELKRLQTLYQPDVVTKKDSNTAEFKTRKSLTKRLIDCEVEGARVTDQELSRVEKQAAEMQLILEKVEKGEELPKDLSLLQAGRSGAKKWIEQFVKGSAAEGHVIDRSTLSAALRTFLSQLEGQRRMLQENLAIKTEGYSEFDGLTLSTAQNLYLGYTRDRDAIGAQVQQVLYLQETLFDPAFEMSSIPTILTDSVTGELVQKASHIALKLQDPDNRTIREQQRLREELDIQKSFLHQHLVYSVELSKLKLKLLDDKITSLRHCLINMLSTEKKLLQDKLKDLGLKMIPLPEKWRRESLLQLKKDLGVRILEGMAQLAESKNLNQHLYHVASKPLDLSIAPLAPRTSRYFILSLIMGCIGVLGFYFGHLCRALFQGLPVTHDHLKAAGFPTLGRLTPFCEVPCSSLIDGDLETLRATAQFLSTLPKHACAVILGGKNSDYSRAIAELLSMQGRKVLLIRSVFDAIVQPQEKPGLWDYLQTDLTPQSVIRSLPHFDYLPSGGTARLASEMLLGPKFQAFLKDLKGRYDLVLLYSSALPNRMEGMALSQLADALLVSVQDETKEELAAYLAWKESQPLSDVAFVCFEPVS